jgi:hypothetical protein
MGSCGGVLTSRARGLLAKKQKRLATPGFSQPPTGCPQKNVVQRMFSRYFRDQGVERAEQRAGVLLQNLAIDIVNRVTGPVVARIVRATCDAAEHAGLGLRFQSACPPTVGMPFSENEMSSDPYRPPARSSTVKLCWRKSATSSRRAMATSA